MSAPKASALIEKYFIELDEHIIGRVQGGKVGDSCFAAAMFVFAAVDSLGRLTAPARIEKRAHPRSRRVLRLYFPPTYLAEDQRLWKLRNALMHNGLNAATFLAATRSEDARYEHLESVPGTDYLFLNTGCFHEDVCKAVEQVKHELREPEKAAEAASRLEEAVLPGFREPPTPPPIVWFRQLRR